MQKLILILISLFIVNVAFTQHEHHQPKVEVSNTSSDKPKSPRTNAMAMVGDNHVHIDYGSPSVRGRNIWNGLVAYDQVWASGAHKATWIDFSEDITIDGIMIPKGKYGFFTIPNQNEWTLIINKSWDMHLADDYNQENDMIRMKVIPKENSEVVEALTYEVKSLGDGAGSIIMSWDKLSVSFNFENTK